MSNCLLCESTYLHYPQLLFDWDCVSVDDCSMKVPFRLHQIVCTCFSVNPYISVTATYWSARVFVSVDEVAWRLPSETIMFTDRLVHEVVSSNALKAHLNCSYLHPRVMGSVSEVLLKSLGVKVLQTGELIDILSSVVSAARQTGRRTKEHLLIDVKWDIMSIARIMCREGSFVKPSAVKVSMYVRLLWRRI